MLFRAQVLLALSASIAAATADTAGAEIFKWQADSGQWSDPNNWIGGRVPVNAADSVVDLTGGGRSNQHFTIDNARPEWAINHLAINDLATVTLAPGTVLRLTGTTPRLDGRRWTVNGPLVLDSMVAVYTGGTPTALSGPITGAGGLNFTAARGQVRLSGENSFSGGISGNPNWIILEKPASLGTGPMNVNMQDSLLINLPLQAESTTINALTFNGFSIEDRAYIAIQGNAPAHAVVLPSLTANGRLSFSLRAREGTSALVNTTIQTLTLGGTLRLNGGGFIHNSVPYLASTGSLTIQNIQETTPSTLIVGESKAAITGTGSYTGGTVIQFGHLTAHAPHALGTGPITINNGTLTLNAANAARSTISGSNGTLHYNANGAAGGHVIQSTNVWAGPSVTSFSNGSAPDTLSTLTGIHGPNALLSQLDRGVGSATVPNITFAALAVVHDTGGGLPAVQNLGVNADLTLGLNDNSALAVTIGTGTPWGGLHARNYGGAVTTNGPITLGGSFSGNASFHAAAGSPANAAILVPGGASLGGTGIIPRPVTLAASSQLEPGAYNPDTGQSSPGTLTLDSLVLNSLTTLRFDLGTPNQPGAAQNDLLVVLGNLTWDGALTLAPAPGFGPGEYTLATYGGTLQNLGVSLPNVSGYVFTLDYAIPGRVVLKASNVPEPSTLLFTLAVAGSVLLRRRSVNRRGLSES